MSEKYDFMENFDKNNNRFKAEISKYIDENIRKEGYIVLGETPPVLALAEADTKLPLVIENVAIDHIIDEHINTKRNKERIFKENILNMYQYLLNPVCIISGDKKGTIIVLSDELNINNDNIIIPIEISKQANSYRANFIDTEYPKKNILIYFVKEYLKHNLIAINNKKLEDLLRPIGLLLPVEHTSTSSNNIITKINELVNSYDDSIIHNLDNVKYSKINDLENRYFKFNTDNMFFKPTFRANYLELNNACKELGWGDALQYFTEGEKLSKVRDKEYLWKIEMFKYDKDREQLQNKLIELKTKEIENKLKEIKEMLNKINVNEDVKKLIRNSINSYLQNNEYNGAVTLDQKIVHNYEYLKDHFGSAIRGEKGVGYHAAQGASLGLFIDDPRAEEKFYPNLKDEGEAFEQYCKDCSVVFNEMYDESKENLSKIKESIRSDVLDFIDGNGSGNTIEEKIVDCYIYYENVFEQNHKKNVKGNVGAYIAQDGNLSVYHDDIRTLYGLDIPSKISEKYDVENQALWEIYKDDVNKIFEEEYSEALNKIKEKNKYAEVIAKAEKETGKDTLKEDCAKIVSDMEKNSQESNSKENEKGQEISEKEIPTVDIDINNFKSINIEDKITKEQKGIDKDKFIKYLYENNIIANRNSKYDFENQNIIAHLYFPYTDGDFFITNFEKKNSDVLLYGYCHYGDDILAQPEYISLNSLDNYVESVETINKGTYREIHRKPIPLQLETNKFVFGQRVKDFVKSNNRTYGMKKMVKNIDFNDNINKFKIIEQNNDLSSLDNKENRTEKQGTQYDINEINKGFDQLVKDVESMQENNIESEEPNKYAEAIEKAEKETGKDTLKEDCAKIVSDIEKNSQESNSKDNEKGKEKSNKGNEGR